MSVRLVIAYAECSQQTWVHFSLKLSIMYGTLRFIQQCLERGDIALNATLQLY